MQTLIVMALKDESQGLFESAGYKPFYCGVGATTSSFRLTRHLVENKISRVLNLGTAGSQRFQKGDLVECVSFIQRQPNGLNPFQPPILQAQPLTDLPKAVCGSADFIENSKPFTACDVFDMEAYSLAYVCKQMNTSFCSIKFISDQSDENLLQDWKKNILRGAETLLKEIKKYDLST